MILTDGPRRKLAFFALLAALALTGCGREPSDETSTSEAGSTTTEAEAEPLGPPEAKESLKDATERLARAIDSENCKEISEFNLSSRVVEDEEARCETLTTLFGGRKVLASEEFTGGGVADYEYGDYGITAVMIVEDDLRYHLAYADNLLDGKSAGTPPAREFDRVAEDAFEALSERDCQAFQDIANKRHGRGAVEEEAACAYVEGNPVPALAESNPDLAPELLGANSDYALYSLSTPGGTMTIVLGRAEDPAAGLSEAYEPLPRNAAEYGFVDLIATEPSEPPDN